MTAKSFLQGCKVLEDLNISRCRLLTDLGLEYLAKGSGAPKPTPLKVRGTKDYSSFSFNFFLNLGIELFSLFVWFPGSFRSILLQSISRYNAGATEQEGPLHSNVPG